MHFETKKPKECLESACPSDPGPQPLPTPPAPISLCSEPFPIASLRKGDSLFVLSLTAVAQGPSNETRARAIMLDGAPPDALVSRGFTKKADLVHAKTGTTVIRSNLDFSQKPANLSTIVINHRNTQNLPARTFPLGENEQREMKWNCNRFEALVGATRIFLAKSEDRFPVAGDELAPTSRLPIEVGKN